MGGGGVEKMGGMPKAWSVPSDSPMHRSPSGGCVQEEAMASVPKPLPFSRTFKLLCSGLAHQGPGDKPRRWRKSVCPVGTDGGQNPSLAPLSSHHRGSGRRCVCEAPPLRTKRQGAQALSRAGATDSAGTASPGEPGTPQHSEIRSPGAPPPPSKSPPPLLPTAGSPLTLSPAE